MRLAARFLAALGCVLVALQPVDARRVVLVIGNAEYKVEPLQNPVNDAEAVARIFAKQLNFDRVILKKNLGAEAFRAALLEFAREVSGAEVAAVYFAGHGVEAAGKNFLVPTDAKLARAGDLALEAIPLDTVLDQLAGASKLRLVILDACRKNPFPLSALAGGKRAVGRGLSAVAPDDNTLVVYAAKEGTTADDGPRGRHSPFTKALLRHIATPGLEINFVFRRVRDDVLAATSREQQPHVYGSLGSQEFFLLPKAPESAAIKKKEEELAKKKEEELASLKAELDRLKAEVASKPKSPAPVPAEDAAKLKATIARLEAEVKRLEALRPQVPLREAPSPAPKAKHQARPNPTRYSLKIWPPGSLKLGQTVTADTPYGPLSCISQGPPSGGLASRPCRWGR